MYRLNYTWHHVDRSSIKTESKKFTMMRNTFSHKKNLFSQVRGFLSERFIIMNVKVNYNNKLTYLHKMIKFSLPDVLKTTRKSS